MKSEKNQPISSEQTSVLKAGQATIVVGNMKEFSEENLPAARGTTAILTML